MANKPTTMIATINLACSSPLAVRSERSFVPKAVHQQRLDRGSHRQGEGIGGMPKAIHAQEGAHGAKEKAHEAVEKLRMMKLAKATDIVEIVSAKRWAATACDGALALPQHQQHGRTADVRVPATNTSRRRVPRRQFGAVVGRRAAPARSIDPLGN
jgi:hypothetical protein